MLKPKTENPLPAREGGGGWLSNVKYPMLWWRKADVTICFILGPQSSLLLFACTLNYIWFISVKFILVMYLPG